MTDVLAPVAGVVGDLADAPDPVFSAEMVGAGAMVLPEDEPMVALAPIGGTVLKAMPHAYIILGESGGVLVHLGINTVKLKGEGFEVLVAKGDAVEPGQEMIRWDPSALTDDMSRHVLVCVMDSSPGSYRSECAGDRLAAGEPLFTL